MKSVFINGHEYALVEFNEFLLLSWNLCTQNRCLYRNSIVLEKGYYISSCLQYFLIKKKRKQKVCVYG